MTHSLSGMSSHGLHATTDLPWSSPHLITVAAMGQRVVSRRLRGLIFMALSKLQPQLTVPSMVAQNIAERKQKANAHCDRRASKQLNDAS